MRISDWSSDVCSSDLTATLLERLTIATRLTGNAGALDQVRAYTLSAEALAAARIGDLIAADPERTTLAGGWNDTSVPLPVAGGSGKIGRAACRERGCQYV